MAVSEGDRMRFRLQAASLKEIESHDPGSPGQRKAVRDWVNLRRARRGLPPFPDEPDLEEFPEEGLYIRARTLGLARRVRRPS